ncbi:MAG: 50S ribosomal protein L15 [Patescibacteria group bacterium]
MSKILSLNNLTPNKEALTRKKIRLGRGDASGHGSYSGKGRKGQKSRTGSGKGLKLFALRQAIMRTPKLRGFKSITPKSAVFNVSDLAVNFKDGSTINLAVLKELNLVRNDIKSFKILGNGEISIKVIIDGGFVSKTAKEKIEKAGGEIKEIKK